MSIDVLFEDGPCLVINKPGGVLTQAAPGIDSMEVRAKEFFRQREGKTTGGIYLGVPHRLDRPVSGALLLARHVRATRRLAEQFEGRMIRKIYWAIVEGVVAEDAGTWRDFVRKVPDEPRAEVVDRQHAEARLAMLNFRVRQRWEDRTWLEIELETGRMHQIRLQAATRQHPVVGDQQYGAARGFGPAYEDWRERSIALHARHVGFRHPMTRAEVRIDAPVPVAWHEWGVEEDG
ncbi:MAG: RluA family pseudouridine synthase [Pirellulaceae bacterium]